MLSTRRDTCHALIYYFSAYAVCVITIVFAVYSLATAYHLCCFEFAVGNGPIIFSIRSILISTSIFPLGKFVVETYYMFFHGLGDVVDGEDAQ
jgi:hypothetical protein